jgi:hypothetical protein
MAEPQDFPVWDATQPVQTLMLMYQWAVDRAQERIQWYEDKGEPRKFLSQVLRIVAISLTAAGALCPLLDATGVFLSKQSGVDSIVLGKWGYVFIAVAAGIIGFDRYFGLSTGWMRFIVTQLSLERSLQEFHYDWAMLLAQQQETSQKLNSTVLLQRLKDFSLQVESLVKQETDAWVMEFQSNVAELETVLKTEAKTRKPGSIKVSVTNAKDFEKVTIRLNDSNIRELAGVSEGLIETVPPGRYEVTAVAKKNDKEYKDSKVVEVQPEAMTSVEITLHPWPVNQ